MLRDAENVVKNVLTEYFAIPFAKQIPLDEKCDDYVRWEDVLAALSSPSSQHHPSNSGGSIAVKSHIRQQEFLVESLVPDFAGINVQKKALLRDQLTLHEVLGVGDGKFRRKAVNAMANKINSNQTVVLVSHSMNHVRKLADRVLWLDAGKVRMIGTPNEVLPAYNLFIDGK